MTDEEMAGGLTDEQMAAPEEGGPESFLHPDKFKPSGAHRKFKNTGPDVAGQMRAASEANREAGSVGNILSQAAAPVLSAADKASLGGLSKGFELAQRINQATGETGPTLASNSLESIERYRHEQPTLSQYTDMPGYMTGGPRMIAGAVERALPAVVTPLHQVARATMGAGLTSAGVAGAESLIRGDEPMDVARETGRGLIGGTAVGLPMSAAAALLGGAGRAVTNSKGGRARQFLEERGVEVGPRTPGRGGPMDTMVTQGTSDADIGHQAEVSATRGLGMLNQEKKGVLGALGRRYGNIQGTPGAANMRDVSSIVSDMQAASEELDTAPQTRSALQDLIGSVKAKQGQGFNADVDPYMLTETDLNKLRRAIDRQARTGVSTAENLSPLKTAAHDAREMVNEGPYAQANADYAKESKYYQESRKLLGINERPKTPEETKTAINTVRHQIERPGQNTITAGGQTQKMRDFAERHPDIAAEFERPEILRKRADIGFNLLPKRHGGLIERTGSGIGGLATAEAVMHALGSGHFDLGKAGAAAALGLTLQNLPAIQARLLYAPADVAQRAAAMLLGDIPSLAAPGREVVQEKR